MQNSSIILNLHLGAMNLFNTFLLLLKLQNKHFGLINRSFIIISRMLPYKYTSSQKKSEKKRSYVILPQDIYCLKIEIDDAKKIQRLIKNVLVVNSLIGFRSVKVAFSMLDFGLPLVFSHSIICITRP